MKHFYFLFVFFVLGFFQANAQCESVYLYNQADVNNFSTNFPSCPTIGTLYITGADVTNLNGLSGVTQVQNLTLTNLPTLTNLTGLNNLSVITGNLEISGTSATTMTSLSGVNSIGGSLNVSSLQNLVSFIGLNNVDSVGGNLTMNSNTALTSLPSMTSLQSVGGYVQVGGNTNLATLSGLNHLESINGTLSVWSNPALSSITGLNALTSINGNLELYSNASLTSLNGIGNINPSGIANLYIYSSEILATCDFPSICGFLANSGSNYITGNAAGCANVTQLLVSCGTPQNCNSVYLQSQAAVDDYAANYGCSAITGDLYISGADITNLDGLSMVTSVGGNLYIQSVPILTDFDGLNNVTSITGLFQLAYGTANNISLLPNLTSIGTYLNFYGTNATTISGFNNLATVGGYISVNSNDTLTTLPAFNSLTSVTSYFQLYNNAVLTAMPALNSLTSAGYIDIGYNPLLTSLSGTATISGLSQINIYGNTTLAVCNTNWVCSQLALGIPNSIYSNASGCDTGTEILGACNPGCPVGNVNLYSQADVDAFETSYPTCTQIGGQLYIGGSDISDLTPLHNITNVVGDLYIYNNSILTNLNGLQNLETVHESLYLQYNYELTSISALNVESIDNTFTVSSNPLLTNLNGLTELTTIGYSLNVSSNAVMTSCQGLGNLTSVPNVAVQYNPEMTSLTGLEGLTTVNNLTVYGNPLLTTIAALDGIDPNEINISTNASLINLNGLTSVIEPNNITISTNAALINLTGLGNVETASSISVNGNAALTNLTGLNNLTSVSNLYVNDNPALTSLTGLNSLSALSYLSIVNNQSLTTIGALNSLTAATNISVSNNDALPNLTGLNGLTTQPSNYFSLDVNNNASLTSLQGLNNLEYAYNISLTGNPALSSLSALSSVTVLNYLTISDNDGLTSLTGLENFNPATFYGLTLNSSETLSTCNIVPICTYLSNGGNSTISGNAIGCNSSVDIQLNCSTAVCPSGPIVFNTQQQIDDFLTTYPTCTSFSSNVTIEGADITNIDGLTNITQVNGSLSINNNPVLTDLDGFDSLTSVTYDVQIQNNAALTSISGLGSLQTLSSMTITNNDDLTSLSGLTNIQTLSNFTINDNALLTSLGTLSFTALTGGLIISNNPALTTLGGLQTLTSVYYLTIENNDALTNLTALSAMTSIYYYYYYPLNINNNGALTSLSGLQNIDPATIGYLYIYNNPNLSFCDLPNICTFLSNNGNNYITGNAANCNSEENIQLACGNDEAPTFLSVSPSVLNLCTNALGELQFAGLVPNSNNRIYYSFGELTDLSIDVNADDTGMATSSVYGFPSYNGLTLTVTSVERIDVATGTISVSNNNTVLYNITETVTYYADTDNDGFGNYYNSVNSCGSQPVGYVTNFSDCNDSDATLFQTATIYIDSDADGYTSGQTSICYGTSLPAGYSNTSLGSDCDDSNALRHSLFSFYTDADNDGYGFGGLTTACALDSTTPPTGYSVNNTDCSPANVNLYQSATLYVDADGDGYDNGSNVLCYGAIPPAGYSATTSGADCDDNNAAAHIGQIFYVDADGDGYGTGTSNNTCSDGTPPAGYSANNTDCNDANGSVYQSANVYIDNDQDGYTVGFVNLCYGATMPAGYSPDSDGSDCDDTNASAHTGFAFYLDADGDGFGTGGLIGNICASNSTTAPAGYSLNNTDCDDTKPGIWTSYDFYADADNDTYGTGSLISICAANATTPPLGYSDNNFDCNDSDASMHQTYAFFADNDNDGYGAGTLVQACAQNNLTAPAGYSILDTDCDDANISRHPGMTEYCGNGIDDDCDGLTDREDPDSSGSQNYYADADADGFGNPAITISSCNIPAGYVADDTDCDDADALEFPGQTWYTDADGDDYGTETSVVQCTRPANGFAAAELMSVSGDCDDSNASINPGAQHIEFSGSPSFTTSVIAPLSGSLYSTFTFEAIYFDANNALPPPTFPRVHLDYEGDGNFTSGNDRSLIMTPADATDTNTVDGKKYIGSINALPYGTNWKTSVEVISSGCVTMLGPIDAPDVFVSPNVQLFANDITFSSNHPEVSSPLTVNATIHNVSDFAAQNFTVHLINQYDPSIVYGDITVPFVAAQSQTTVTWNITTPALPAWCPMQVLIDYSNAISETNELDNSAVRPFINGNYNLLGGINVTASASPSVSVIYGNEYITVYGHADYFGTPTPLIDPSVAGATVDLTLTETGQTFSGHSDSAGNYSITFLAPNVVGDYHITGTITDYTFESALSTEFSRIIIVTCPVDLELWYSNDINIIANTTLSGPYVPENTIIQGESISGSITVHSGCADIPATTITNVSQTGGLPLISDFTVPALIGSSSYAQNFSNIVFNTPGTYNLCATANSTNTVTEDYYGNNGYCESITVLPNLPDITPVDGPGSYQYLCQANNSVGFNLFNSGGAASGTFDCDIIVNLDGIYQQTLHHTVNNIAPLNYASFELPFTYSQVGNYSFQIQCDVPMPNGTVVEYNETNNIADYSVAIYECKADLFVQTCESPDVLPANPQFGANGTYNAIITNGGNASATGPIEVTFTLSDGQNYIVNYPNSLAPNESATVSVNGIIPATVSQTLTVTVDANNVVNEYSETNNTESGSLCHDFQPVDVCGGYWYGAALKNSSRYLAIGLNQYGLYDASSVDVRFEVSGPGLVGTVNLGNATVQNVEKNCSCPYTAALPYSFVFPDEGVYTFTMTADPDHVYTECDETNNVIIRTIEVYNTPDMQVLSQFINPSLLNPEPGEQITMNVTYENLGLSNSDDIMTMQVFVDEVLLQTLYPVTGLGTGENQTLAVTVPWSSEAPGAHIIRTVIDSNNDIVEYNEMNNEATRAVVVGEAANFKFNSFASSNPTPTVNSAITFHLEIANQGDLDAEADVEFYYVSNSFLEMPIGTIHIAVPNNSSAEFDYPWIVLDASTTIKAKIVNSNVLEFTYDDNEATTVLGGINLAFQSTPACTGGNNGTLTIQPTGGQAPYSYQWQNGFNQATLTAAAGTYSVTVTDSNGLTSTASGTITEGGTGTNTFYADTDNDGFGDALSTTTACEAPAGYVADDSDCDDSDATIYQASNLYIDSDSDGYDNGTQTVCYGATAPAGYSLTTSGMDCDDTNPTVFTGFDFYVDSDGDTYGTGSAVTLCAADSNTPPTGYATNDSDCDDTNPTVFTGFDFYVDADGDTYGTGSAVNLCAADANTPPTGYSINDSDCDDTNPAVFTGFEFYVDADGDTFGTGTAVNLCAADVNTPPTGYATNDSDCDDTNPTVFRGFDFYVDADGDTFGTGTAVNLCASDANTPPTGYATNDSDCDDTNPAVFTGFDFYVDADGDTFGTGTAVNLCAADANTPPTGYSLNYFDCNDTDPTLYLYGNLYADSDGDGYDSGLVADLCYGSAIPDGYMENTIGEDCNDNNADVYQTGDLFVDADGDGYDNGLQSLCYGAIAPIGYSMTTSGADCDDTNAAISAGYDFYADADGDTYGAGALITLCAIDASLPPTGYSVNNLDCDDTNYLVNPSRSEALYNGVDDNCSGQLDEGYQILSQIQPNQCGITLATINTVIAAVGKPNTTAYRFKIVNMANSETGFIVSPVPTFNITQMPNYNYSTSYMISVEIQRNGIWLGYYGPACQINTPSILQPGGAAQLVPSICGATLPTISTTIATNSINGVTGYKFRVTNISNPLAPNQEQVLERNVNWFTLAMLPTYHYGTTYSVDVSVKTNGNYSAYGSPCNVTSPAVPGILNCGVHYTNATQKIVTTSMNKATAYRFEVSRLDSNGVMVETIIVDKTVPYFNVGQIPGMVPGAEYSIRVSIGTSGSWSPYGLACSIFAPAQARTSEPIAETIFVIPFTVTAFPSPFTESFSFNVDTSSEEKISIAIYDMAGRLLEQNTFAAELFEIQAFGQRYPSGVFNVTITQGTNLKTLRVIKK